MATPQTRRPLCDVDCGSDLGIEAVSKDDRAGIGAAISNISWPSPPYREPEL